MSRAVILATIVLALVGCASVPDTSAAYKTCYETLVEADGIDDAGLTTEEYTAAAAAIAEECALGAEQDPAGFIEFWSAH